MPEDPDEELEDDEQGIGHTAKDRDAEDLLRPLRIDPFRLHVSAVR